MKDFKSTLAVLLPLLLNIILGAILLTWANLHLSGAVTVLVALITFSSGAAFVMAVAKLLMPKTNE